MTVFLRASTKPSGEPKRKKSDTSKSNFPREPPSSIVLLLDLRETVSFLRTLECKLEGQHKVISMRTKSTENKDCQRFFFFLSSHAQQTWSGRPGVVLLCPLRRWRSRFSCVAAVSCCRRLCRHGGCRCYCGWGGGCPPGWERLTRARCWQWCQERGGPGPEGAIQ